MRFAVEPWAHSRSVTLPKKRSQKTLDYVMKAKIVIDLSYERQTICDASFGGRKSSNSIVLLLDFL